MTMYVVHILSLPALVYQIEANVNDSMQMFHTHTILERSLSLLEKEQNMKIVTNSLKACQLLALLANIIHLFHVESLESAMQLGFPTFTVGVYSVSILSGRTFVINFILTTFFFCCWCFPTTFSLFAWNWRKVYRIVWDKRPAHFHNGMIYWDGLHHARMCRTTKIWHSSKSNCICCGAIEMWKYYWVRLISHTQYPDRN